MTFTFHVGRIRGVSTTERKAMADEQTKQNWRKDTQERYEQGGWRAAAPNDSPAGENRDAGKKSGKK